MSQAFIIVGTFVSTDRSIVEIIRAKMITGRNDVGFLFDLFFDLEDGGDIFLRHVS
jgi:hypothetical protein